ncbi:MAG: TadE family protein [Blastocatellales bacterium]
MRKLQKKTYQLQFRKQQVQQGQALLEFALSLLILFVMLLGVTIIAQGFNLQMVLYGAAYEGARIWAKNPILGSSDLCTPPACDANSGTANNFDKYIAPAIRQYMTNNGFDGSAQAGKLHFFSKDKNAAQNALTAVSRDPQRVTVTLLYSIELPFTTPKDTPLDFSYREIQVIASCTLKRGS